MATSIEKENWKTFAYWAFWVGIAFFSVYPACNWLSAQRDITYPLYLDAELGIPLVPGFFWLYMSMYVLFFFPPFFLNRRQLTLLGQRLILTTILSGVIFLLIPTELGFARVQPDNPFYSTLFAQLFTIDLPHNLVPSLHVVFSAIIIFSILETMETRLSKSFFWLWLILLCLSTLLVHQHHLLDVITGLLIAILATTLWKGSYNHA